MGLFVQIKYRIMNFKTTKESKEEKLCKTLGLVWVSAGWMGKAHSSAILNSQMLFGPEYGTAVFEIVADTNEASLKEAQHKIGFNRITTDWREVVTDSNVDVVDVATPNAFHYEVAKAALANGKLGRIMRFTGTYD